MLRLFENRDCMEGMKEYPDKFFDLAIVDPPYGIKDWNKRGSNKKLYAGNNAHRLREWDVKPTKEYWAELFRTSKEQIVWGANHFIEHLKNTKATIIWDKNNVGMHFNNYELAWVNGRKEANRIFRMSTSQIAETLIHPTQKPIALYRWLLENYAQPSDKILDTHVGSASSLIACEALGFEYVGFEIDKDYYEAAKKRLEDWRSLPLFDEKKAEESNQLDLAI